MATNNYIPPQINPTEKLGKQGYQDFLLSTFNYKNSSTYPWNKRIFITLCEPQSSSAAPFEPPGYSGSDGISPIRTTLTGSYIDSIGSFNTNNLAELSTAEISSLGEDDEFMLSGEFRLNQPYAAVSKSQAAHNLDPQPSNFTSGSYVLTMCDDSSPSLLVELNKGYSLPDGIGRKEFVVIPENLHPFIKDNISYFLTRAGVNVSGETSPMINLNETNRNLP